jgi:hypothetical protein
MTDLEICKRIAEIEGNKATVVECADGSWLCGEECDEYNPLTDKALCFDLMVKYKVEVEWCGNECATYKDELQREIHDISPQKAICLAIIEANKE